MVGRSHTAVPRTDDRSDTYLIEGRLTVESVSDEEIRATVRGLSRSYRLGHDRNGWWCDCGSTRSCSHLRALQRVTAPRVT